LETFHGETPHTAPELKVDVIQANTMPLQDLLATSLARERPFVGKGYDERDPTAFHDAEILLASLRDAKATGQGS
jgi:hypothetical protein